MNRVLTLLLTVATALLAASNGYARSTANPMSLMETPARQAASIYPSIPTDRVGAAVGPLFPGVAEKPAIGSIRSPVDPFGEIEKTIRSANIGEPSLRNPVPESAIRDLRASLAEQGMELTPAEVTSAVDYAHALLRESPGTWLYDKVVWGLDKERAAFHGNVAELSEARARGMVLTKDLQSEHFDLTEPKFGARSAQLKVYKDPARGLSETIDDLKALPVKAGRYGIMPRDSLLEVERRGLVYRRTIGDSEFFIPREDPSIKLLPARSFSTYSESVDYAERGRGILRGLVRGGSGEAGAVERGGPGGAEGLVEGGAIGTAGASSSTLVFAGKALGVAAVLATAGIEVHNVYEWYDGRMSTRRLAVSSVGLGGGIVGGSGGAWAGAAIGAAAGSEVPIIGNVAGGIIGGIIGGFAGGWAGSSATGYLANSYFRFEDNKFGRQQQRELMQFLTKYYSRPASTGSAGAP